MLIHNYGLFWRREHIFWGRGRDPGHLKGFKAKAKRQDPVDFREQQGVYALYDDAFQLVYVGQAGANDRHRLFDRLKDHRDDPLADRWSRFSWFGVRAVNQSGELRAENIAAHADLGDVLNHIEAILIVTSEPPHNRQGGRFGEKVEQYLQHQDKKKLGPDVNTMIREMWAQSQRA